MASQVIQALFSAKETISETLTNVERAFDTFDQSIDGLVSTMNEAQVNTDGLEQEFESLQDGARSLRVSQTSLKNNLERVQRTLDGVSTASELTESEMQTLERSLIGVFSSTQNVDSSLNSMDDALSEISFSTEITNEMVEALNREFTNVKRSTQTAESGVNSLIGKMAGVSSTTDSADRSITDFNSSIQMLVPNALGAAKAANKLDERIDDLNRSVPTLAGSTVSAIPSVNLFEHSLRAVEDEAEEASDEIQKLSANMGILGAISESTALDFGNLSVNIGPFNIALHNLLTQLPAIITGMSTMLAIVTSLAAAFLTLGAATGALLAGGALFFFEDFSEQFEDTAQAAEALMGALKDLFIDALEPLMTEANMDLFIAAIEGAARMVNRFAQFFQQMRGEIMGFFSQVGGNADSFFESMHDSFVILEPIMLGLVEFFLQDLPNIIVRFSELTKTISGDLSRISQALGGLIVELMDFASILIAGLEPVIEAVVIALTLFFKALNKLNSDALAAAITLAAFTAIITKGVLAIYSLTGALATANAALTAQAVAGVGSAQVLKVLYGNLLLVAAGETTLSAALSRTTSALLANTAASLKNISMKITNSIVTNALTGAMARQLLIMSNLIAGKITLNAALAATKLNILATLGAMKAYTVGLITNAGAMVGSYIPAVFGGAVAASVYTAATTAAAAATWALNGAIAVLTSPITAVIAAILIVVGLLAQIAGFNPFGAIIEGIKEASDVAAKLIDKLNVIPGLGGMGGGGGGGTSVTNTNDIQTEPNVDLDFEDKIEQNIDVQADPEEKEQMRRVVKDAMNEANSIARRQEGVGQ